MPINTEYKIIFFESVKQWEEWLEKNHAITQGVWIRLFKKGSDVKSITYAEAVEVALCYGWIDSQVKKYDEKSYLQKFTPRRSKSIWSKINTEHIERLIEAGRMKPAGMKQIEEAKKDGRWVAAYDSPSTAVVPKELKEAFAKNKKAQEFFKTLNKTNTYAIIWRIQTAKKPETKQKRITAIIEMLEKGEKFH